MKSQFIAKALTLIMIVIVVIGILGILISILASGFAFTGYLPERFVPSMEIPITVNNLNQYFDFSTLKDHYSDVELEMRGLNLELVPRSADNIEGWIYLFVAIYIAFYSYAAFLLYKILRSIAQGQAFDPAQYVRIRDLGIAVIVIELFHILIIPILGGLWSDLTNILPQGISTNFQLEIDFAVIFLGMIILVLSEIFRQGSHLKELEELTV